MGGGRARDTSATSGGAANHGTIVIRTCQHESHPHLHTSAQSGLVHWIDIGSGAMVTDLIQFTRFLLQRWHDVDILTVDCTLVGINNMQ